MVTYYQVNLDRKSFGQQFIITLISYFTGVGLENTWTTNMDYNYILQDFCLKIIGLRIWISIVIYGSGVENTWTTNLDYDYQILTGFGLGNTWALIQLGLYD